MAVSGSVVWPSVEEPLWRFNWRLANSPDEEGTVISNAFYRGHQVFYKASLPVLRVQYDNPSHTKYKDPLNYDNSSVTNRCPSSRVCIYSYVSYGLRGLGVDSYHIYGNYRLTHRWVFWEDGQVYPRLYSAGLQHDANHRHHAYWRLDFDIDTASNNLALEYNTYTGNTGYGNGWHVKNYEISRLKYPSSRRSWAVMNTISGRGYHILPGPNDGVADTFSTRDIWILKYHGSEDRNGRQGSASSDDLNYYLNNEDINGKDVVLWYCSHLFHEVSDHGNEWHHAGPNLIPFRY